MSDIPEDDFADDVPVTPRNRKFDWTFLIGVAYSAIVPVVILGGGSLLGPPAVKDSNGIIVIAVLLPILMGLAAAFGWRKPDLSVWQVIGWTVGAFFIDLLLVGILAREGVFCLLIISPLILLLMGIGVLVGKLVFRRKSTRLNLSLAALLGLFALIDIISPHHYSALVSDTIIIHAPVSKVWPHVVAFPEITSKPSYWFFRIGLPMPASTTVEGYRKGAGRKCIFSNGLVFDEVMTEFEPDHRLTFDITHQPEDPEIMGHLSLQRGQFILTDNGDGTTTLTGNSWYVLHTFPAWYFDLWANSIVRNVHLRVMEHIRDLSEG
ncbi:MAG: SRPBCC family protein [Candidatus Kapaibacterium sp.]